MQRHEGGYYIRLTVHDRPGVAAGVATRMAEADISLESILQKRSEIAATKDPHGRSGAPVPLVLITYAATEAVDPLGPGKNLGGWSYRRAAPSHPHRTRVTSTQAPYRPAD